jgi:hypothetical protein
LAVLVKTTSKPAANILKMFIKNQGVMQGFFVQVGHKAHMLEVKVKAKAKNIHYHLDEIEVPPIEKEIAFVKGVEYFVEFIVLYGLIGILSLMEVMKSIKASKKLKKDMINLEQRNII